MARGRAASARPFTLLVPYPDGTVFPRRAVDGRGAAARAAAGHRENAGVRVPDWPPSARALGRLPSRCWLSANRARSDPPICRASRRRARGLRPLLDGPTGGVSSTVLDLSGLKRAGFPSCVRSAGVVEVAAILELGKDREHCEKPAHDPVACSRPAAGNRWDLSRSRD